MKAYLGEATEIYPITARAIKLGTVARVALSMTDMSGYTVKFEEENLRLFLRFRDGGHCDVITDGLEHMCPFLDPENLDAMQMSMIHIVDSQLTPELRKAAGQPDNVEWDHAQEHRFYTSLAIFIAGRLPGLVSIESDNAPFSEVILTFEINGKRVVKNVEFPPMPEHEELEAFFDIVQKELVRRSLALMGGNN